MYEDIEILTLLSLGSIKKSVAIPQFNMSAIPRGVHKISSFVSLTVAVKQLPVARMARPSFLALILDKLIFLATLLHF